MLQLAAMKDTTMPYKLSVLRHGLEVLSLNYAQQQKRYPVFVDVFDEVLGDFGDGLLLLPALIREGIINKEAHRYINICNRLIGESLKEEEKCTDYSFQYDESWNQIRHYAAKALHLIPEQLRI